MGAIVLVPLPGSDILDLEELAIEIEATLHREVLIGATIRDIDLAYDPSRDQYSSRTLLDLLQRLVPTPNEKILGVTSLDLFIPILTFVFGEAQLNGAAAVVSLFRLDNRFYGMPEDDGLLRRRLVKEAIHELGHTYGLVHCPDSICVMRSSTYVEEIDLKKQQFCTDCGEQLFSMPLQ